MIQVALQVMEMPENAYVNKKLLQAQLVSPTHSSSSIGGGALAHTIGARRTWPWSRRCFMLLFWAC